MGNVRNQFLAVIAANVCTLAYAILVGWMASHLSLFRTDECPLPSGIVAEHEIGWIASILGIGGLVGTLSGGWMADRFGRKNSTLALAIPQTGAVVLVMIAQNVYYLYGSKFLSGFVGGAVFVLVPLMVAEIAEDSIRGALSTLVVVGSAGGVLVGFIAGDTLPYEMGPWFCLSFPVIFFVLYSFFPETPYYLAKTNRMEDAEKSLRFYRNISPSASTKGDHVFEHEFSKLKCSYSEVKSKDPEATPDKSSVRLSDFINRPFAICCILMVGHEVNGVFTMVNYAKIIFEKSGSTLDPGKSAIAVVLLQLLGCLASSLLIERLGRKLLLAISSAGAGICQIILGTFIFLATSTSIDLTPFQFVPVAAFSAMIFIASCGAMPIPYVILGEILPDNIRSIGVTLVSCISWALTFVLIKIFYQLEFILQLYGVIYAFALFCFATVVYVLIALPETKGKSLDEILLILKAK